MIESFCSNLGPQLAFRKILVGFILEKALRLLQVLIRLLQSLPELLRRHLACFPGSLCHLGSCLRIWIFSGI